MRVIDADALRKRIKAKNASNAMMKAMREKCVAEIDDAPTIEPEPKKGRWITKSTNGEMFDSCSVCGYVEWDVPRNYCPNCWADMRGK